MITKKTGIRGCVGKKNYFFTNVRSGTPACRQVTLLGNCVYRGKGGGLICRETGQNGSVMITIKEAFNWVYCNINEEVGATEGL